MNRLMLTSTSEQDLGPAWDYAQGLYTARHLARAMKGIRANNCCRERRQYLGATWKVTTRSRSTNKDASVADETLTAASDAK